jgi:hypothetical protein
MAEAVAAAVEVVAAEAAAGNSLDCPQIKAIAGKLQPLLVEGIVIPSASEECACSARSTHNYKRLRRPPKTATTESLTPPDQTHDTKTAPAALLPHA